ncbi:FMN-binding negative transcriptional regulator [Pasteurella skyensis]|uniref:FMN-binding negative transcriptional regulator n=1 Tax=Phocoenobacter skyensis TaxID=97481 RepID=A0AAJ6NC34_9PAST|nr:FMN-binding negative transcriptional regulator [Pasteurella skyensis]MDP8169980.1 FMN-binding negative transcriptional regulator [Pasteurella skyensis]MDP8174084.1 FMN-binding negative transcriptional regulator [Pasteurella skyensis]
MYIPKKFQHDNLNDIQDLVHEFPLATIVTSNSGNIEACHVPLYLEFVDDNIILYGHLAKVNPLLKSQLHDNKWLVIFQDMGHYISPNWYPNKIVTHKEVPTWNYRSVHFTVKPMFITEFDELKSIISKLSEIHEQIEPMPWSINHAPEKFIESMCKAIVGIRLTVLDIQSQFKLSQNKDAKTKENVATQLRKIGSTNAQKMAENIGKYNDKK